MYYVYMECKDTIGLQIVGRHATNLYSGSILFNNGVSVGLKSGVVKTCSDPEKLKEILLASIFDLSEGKAGNEDEFDYNKTLLEVVSGLDERFMGRVPFFDFLYFKTTESPMTFDSTINQSLLPVEMRTGGRLSDLYSGGKLFSSSITVLLYAVGIGRISCSFDETLIASLEAYEKNILLGVKSLFGQGMCDKLTKSIIERAEEYPACIAIDDIKRRFIGLNEALNGVVSKTFVSKVIEKAKKDLHFKMRSDIEYLEK